MGCRMVSCRKISYLFVYGKMHFLRNRELSFFHNTEMCNLPSLKMNGFIHKEKSVVSADLSLVSLLSAHCPVERCPIRNDCRLLPRSNLLTDTAFSFLIGKKYERFYCGIFFQRIISVKRRANARIQFLVNIIASHIIGRFSCRSGSVSLYLHRLMKGFFIEIHFRILQNLFCQIQGETVGIIKTEGIFSGKCLLLLLL